MSTTSKKSIKLSFDKRASICVDEIKEEMNDDDVRKSLNFHYKANIDVNRDKFNLIKLSNNSKNNNHDLSINNSLDSIDNS